jgi:hypothetical protein
MGYRDLARFLLIALFWLPSVLLLVLLPSQLFFIFPLFSPASFASQARGDLARLSSASRLASFFLFFLIPNLQHWSTIFTSD